MKEHCKVICAFGCGPAVLEGANFTQPTATVVLLTGLNSISRKIKKYLNNVASFCHFVPLIP